jgi:hypothetical protein
MIPLSQFVWLSGICREKSQIWEGACGSTACTLLNLASATAIPMNQNSSQPPDRELGVKIVTSFMDIYSISDCGAWNV